MTKVSPSCALARKNSEPFHMICLREEVGSTDAVDRVELLALLDEVSDVPRLSVDVARDVDLTARAARKNTASAIAATDLAAQGRAD